MLSRALKRVRARSASLYPDSPILSADDLDDCAICPPPPNPNSRTVHTIDFFRSFVSDPFVFGKIAAVHALSDCHAMGAVATTALALAVCLYAANESITEDTLFHMLAGATDALQEDGCRLVGGHTCEGAELGLGFAVNGCASARRQNHVAELTSLPPQVPGRGPGGDEEAGRQGESRQEIDRKPCTMHPL